MPVVYIAEPIDQADGKAYLEVWGRAGIVHHLNANGIGVYRPSKAFDLGGVAPNGIVNAVNEAALVRADGVLALMPKFVPSIGVPAEVQRAIQFGMPVVIVTDQERSWVLRGWNDLPNVRVFVHRPETNGEGPYVSNNIVQETLVAMIEEYLLDPDRNVSDEINLPVKDVSGHDPDNPSLDEIMPRLPERAYQHDAGLDLTASYSITCYGGYTDVPTGVAVGFPPEVWGLIMGRSSTTRKLGLLVTQAVIDPGFRGELFVGVFNPGSDPVKIEAGDRIGQLVLMPSMHEYQPEWVKELPEPADGRGENGFGSSGR